MLFDLTDYKSTLFQEIAISWANVDQNLCNDIASLGYNELTHDEI